MAYLMVTLSDHFKDSIGLYASTAGLSSAEVVRRAVSALVGYDLSLDKRTRRSKYDSDADKVAARKARAKQKRDEDKRILELVRRQLRKEDIAYLARSVKE